MIASSPAPLTMVLPHSPDDPMVYIVKPRGELHAMWNGLSFDRTDVPDLIARHGLGLR